MTDVATYNFPTRIRFGAGARHELKALLLERGLSRPLFVTDRGVSALPWFSSLVSALEGDLETAVFDDMMGNPVVSHVTAGVKIAQAHQADAIIAVGGGAPVDVGKVVALMQHHPGHLFDYEDELPGARPVDQHIPFIVALPTTAGTGSEVGRSSVISDDETHAKKIIFSPRILPEVVLADPELTLGLPAGITAATGFDALTHLMEAYLAKAEHPMCEGIALEGIRLVQQSLGAAVEFAKAGDEGQREAHVDARADMLNASIMGAVAFQKGLGVNHSCAHALSTVFDMHHGLANAVMLEAAMHFNCDAVPEKFLEMAQVVGRQTPEGFIDWFVDLRELVGLPSGLGAMGLDRDRIPDLVEVAVADACHPNNPVPVTKEDFEQIFKRAFER